MLYRWLEKRDKYLTELTLSDLLEYVLFQKETGAHPNSINRRLVVCHLLYRFWTSKEMVPGQGATLPATYYRGRGRDRALGIHAIGKATKKNLRVKTPRPVIEPLRPEQVRSFLFSLKRYRDLAIVYLMLLCGLRSREVLSLEFEDMVFEENRLRVKGKGNVERVLPMPNVLIITIKRYLWLERPPKSPSSHLFVVLQGKRRGKSMTTTGLRSLFRCRRRKPVLASANAHRFRHTFGTDMARAGVRLSVLKELMGHADDKTTLGYINLSMADIADEYKRAIEEIQKRYERK
jgi:integrase